MRLLATCSAKTWECVTSCDTGCTNPKIQYNFVAGWALICSGHWRCERVIEGKWAHGQQLMLEQVAGGLPIPQEPSEMHWGLVEGALEVSRGQWEVEGGVWAMVD
jgi:hypothetical protein